MLRNLILSLALVAAAILCQAALAQDFPNRPVRIIVPWPPGGNVDITVRARFRSMGVDVMSMRQAEFAAYVRADFEKWRQIGREGNIVIE